MQAALEFKQIIFIFLATFCVISLGAEEVQEWEKLSKQEELELDRQLKLINKPPIKSFQTEYGDIIDCVDIYKQLAFDHPMLKNHTIQMKPTTITKGMRNESKTTYKSLPYIPGNIHCPPGSVPIRRTNKKDLIMAKHIKSLGFNHPRKSHAKTSGLDLGGYHSAVVEYENRIVGGRATINIWNPSVYNAKQYSVSSMWIANGDAEKMNSISVGWAVNRALYSDSRSRLNTYWTADNSHSTGCFNTLCSGFVQVSSKISLGLPLDPVSTYSGSQFEITVSISQDFKTGNWMLMFSDVYVGYWPKAIFTSMAEGANFISWGGEVYSMISDLSPQMGSGHFPEEGYGKAAFVKQIQVIPNIDFSGYSDPDDHSLKLYREAPHCYDVQKGVDKQGHYIFFGGPGNCTFQVD